METRVSIGTVYVVVVTNAAGWHLTPLASTRNEANVLPLFEQLRQQRSPGQLFSVRVHRL